MAKQYVVKTPLVIAKTAEGVNAYFYQGALLEGQQLAEGEIDRLKDGDFIGDTSEVYVPEDAVGPAVPKREAASATDGKGTPDGKKRSDS